MDPRAELHAAYAATHYSIKRVREIRARLGPPTDDPAFTPNDPDDANIRHLERVAAFDGKPALSRLLGRLAAEPEGPRKTELRGHAVALDAGIGPHEQNVERVRLLRESVESGPSGPILDELVAAMEAGTSTWEIRERLVACDALSAAEEEVQAAERDVTAAKRVHTTAAKAHLKAKWYSDRNKRDAELAETVATRAETLESAGAACIAARWRAIIAGEKRDKARAMVDGTKRPRKACSNTQAHLTGPVPRARTAGGTCARCAKR